MDKKLLLLSFVLLSLILGGCSSVNIRTDDAPEKRQEPDYQQRFSYWWWGLRGEHTVNVREVCLEKKVEQLQAVSTFSDTVLTIITLGIYQPRTARIWCEQADTHNKTQGENQ